MGVKLQFCSVVLKKIDKCGYRYEFDIDCFQKMGHNAKVIFGWLDGDVRVWGREGF